ncbi:hypothetical protein [Psychrosphaera algicola]|uniref:hypothetical protein n=1 Tax=Psychrosphaera algicola TaxID=3023714 RepID=UPI00351D88C7
MNKKNQLVRDRQAGLKRVEIKLHKETYDKASELALERGLSRGEFLADLINESLKNL